MPKLALLNDTHFGCRNDSKTFLTHQERFFSTIFFPTLEQHNIKTILHLGDIFDRRKYINFNTLSESKRIFFDVLKEKNIEMHAILGNHDVYYTTTNEINSVSLLLAEYETIRVYEETPIELTFGLTKIMMCPWLTKDTHASSLNMMKNSNAHVLCGHFDLKGFEMMRGVISEHGIDPIELQHFEYVLSGHYHHPSKNGNVQYIGAQYEMNWTDFDGRRGFYLLDTDTRELTFIENPYKIHYKLEYDDTDLSIEDLNELDTSAFKDTFLKILVKTRNNPYLYELFLTKLNNSGAADIKTIEDTFSADYLSDDELEETKDTKDILHTYIDSITTHIDKSKIKNTIDMLYSEALNL